MASARADQLGIQELCTKEPWWRVPHLVKLNMLLFVPFLSSYVGGFDGSMLNGVQTLTHWKECKFNAYDPIASDRRPKANLAVDLQTSTIHQGPS
jgi:hypothetical protein